jgi:exosortase/archaeosortase family protein
MVKRKAKKRIVHKKRNTKTTKKTRGTSKREHREKLVIFCIKFFAIFVILSIIINALDLSALNNTIATIVGLLLGLPVAGNSILFASTFFLITNSCTGFISASILAAIIFSLKKPDLMEKFKLFIVGLIILLAINVPRIVLVVYSAMIGFDAELVHILTWFLMSAIVLAIWYYGTKRVTKIHDFSELL